MNPPPTDSSQRFWYSDPIRLLTVVNHVYIHLSVSTSVVYNHIGIFHHTVYVLVLSSIAVMLPYAITPLSVCAVCRLGGSRCHLVSRQASALATLRQIRTKPPNLAQLASQFSPHVFCGQTAGWIRMPLVTEQGLDPGHIVLDGAQLLRKSATAPPPLFCRCLLWPNGRYLIS